LRDTGPKFFKAHETGNVPRKPEMSQGKRDCPTETGTKELLFKATWLLYELPFLIWRALQFVHTHTQCLFVLWILTVNTLNSVYTINLLNFLIRADCVFCELRTVNQLVNNIYYNNSIIQQSASARVPGQARQTHLRSLEAWKCVYVHYTFIVVPVGSVETRILCVCILLISVPGNPLRR